MSLCCCCFKRNRVNKLTLEDSIIQATITAFALRQLLAFYKQHTSVYENLAESLENGDFTVQDIIEMKNEEDIGCIETACQRLDQNGGIGILDSEKNNLPHRCNSILKKTLEQLENRRHSSRPSYCIIS